MAEADETTEQNLQRKAYDAATSDLRAKYRTEFNELRAKHAADLGVAWTPRLTEYEKAEKLMAELLAKHPELAGKISIGGE